jgi:tetratricopeptide (TPR) repeat protein
MTMKYSAALSLVLLTFVAALPAQQSLGRGRISGMVVDEQGAPVAAAHVDAQSLQATTKFEATTDKKGHFAVAGMGTGTWRFTVSKEGYVNTVVEALVAQLKPNAPLAVTLKKATGVEGLQSDKAGLSLLDQGIALLKEEKYDEALAAFEQFSEKYPEIYAVRLNIATAYLKKGELARAESEFQGVLDKVVLTHGDVAKDKATSLKAISGLGEVALKKGDFDAAQKSFREALEISPEDQVIAYNVGEILFSNQKADEAIPYFELAIRIKKDWPTPYQRLGLVYLNKGNFDKALENLRKFLEVDSQSPEAENVKAMIAAIEKMKK